MSNHIGILGGGQLARYLHDASQYLGCKPLCFCSTDAEPAATHNRNKFVEPQQNQETLKRFLSQIDILTFENEFVDTAIVDTAHRTKNQSVAIYPSLANLHTLSDKTNQKTLLKELNLPYAKHTTLNPQENQNDVLGWLSTLKSQFPNGVVLKWAKYGYDGYGTRVLTDADLAVNYVDFVKKALDRDTTVFAEELIPFAKERAIVCARDANNKTAFYPLVHTVQKQGVCHLVTGCFTPASPQEQKLFDEAVSHCKALLEKLNYRGVLAVEYFETSEGKLIINEIAPRVHNSAHYTLDAATVSQFEQHVRAVTNIGIRTPASAAEHFAMVNILGGSQAHEASSPRLAPDDVGMNLYWYDKEESRPGRKMGHINIVAQDQSTLEKRIAIALSIAEDFANIK